MATKEELSSRLEEEKQMGLTIVAERNHCQRTLEAVVTELHRYHHTRTQLMFNIMEIINKSGLLDGYEVESNPR